MAEIERSELPQTIDVRLVQDNTPAASLVTLIAQAIAPVLAAGGAITALLLSLGWSYAWHWFAAWNVPFASLGLGADILLEYGRIVVQHFWWLTILWMSAAAFGVWYVHLKKLGTAALAGLFIIIFLAPWLSSHFLSGKAVDASVRKAYAQNFSSWPESHIILRPEHAKALSDNIRQSLSMGPSLCHRLLFRAPDGLWLVRMSSAGRPGAAVFLPKETIVYLRLRAPSGGDC